jgi:hypothetical protein
MPMRHLVALLVACGLVPVAACQSSDVSRAVGARCDTDRDCDDRCLAPSSDWPGGFCTLTCASDSDCASDEACVDEEGAGVCLFLCQTDPGCAFLGNGYTCQERDAHVDSLPPAKVCRG